MNTNPTSRSTRAALSVSVLMGLAVLLVLAMLATPFESLGRGGPLSTSFEPEWLEGQEELVSDNTMPLHGWGDDDFLHLWHGGDQELRIVWGGEQARHFDANATMVVVERKRKTLTAPAEIGNTLALPPLMDQSGDPVLVSRSARGFLQKRGKKSDELTADFDFDPTGAVGLWTPDGPVYVSAFGELLDLRVEQAKKTEILELEDSRLVDMTRCGQSLLLLSTDGENKYTVHALNDEGELETSNTGQPPAPEARLTILCGDSKPVLLGVGDNGIWVKGADSDWGQAADADQLSAWGGSWHVAASVQTSSGLELLWVIKGADEGSFTIYSAPTSDLSNPEALFSVTDSKISSLEDFQCLSVDDEPVCVTRVVWDFGHNMAATPLLLYPGLSNFRWRK